MPEESVDRYHSLVEERDELERALWVHRGRAREALTNRDTLIEHRRVGDALSQRLKNVRLELDIIERMVAMDFQKARPPLPGD